MPTKILVVDDDEMTRVYVTRALQRNGHEVVAVASVQEGLEMLERGGVDVLFSDGSIPPYGVNAWRILANKAMELGIPFVVFSGLLEENDSSLPLFREIQGRGGIPLAKPGSPDAIRQAVRHALSQSES